MLQNGLVRQIYKSGDGTGDLVAASNFSDLESKGGDLDTARTNLEVYSQDENNQFKNALAPARRMAFAAVTRSITIPDGQTNFGTNDFAVFLRLQLGDWTPSSTTSLWRSHDGGNNRVLILLRDTGSLRLVFIDSGGTSTEHTLHDCSGFSATNIFSLFITADRDGDATLYLNGDAQTPVDISAESGVDIGSGNTNDGNLMDFSATTGILYGYAALNYLPPATDGAIWGIDTRYKLAQPVMPEDRASSFNGQNIISDPGFDEPGEWSVVSGDGVEVTGSKLVFDGTGTTSVKTIRNAATKESGIHGVTYRFSFDVENFVTGANMGVHFDTDDIVTVAVTGNGSYSGTITITGNGAGSSPRFRSQNEGAPELDVDNFVIEPLGAVLDLRHIPGLEGSLQVDFGNDIRGTLSTSGVTLPNDEIEGKITVEVANATGSATNTNLLGGSAQPPNTAISKVAYRRTAGTGAFSLGTTSGGTEIINAESGSGDLIDASALVSRNLATEAGDLFVNMAANTTYEITVYFTRIN